MYNAFARGKTNIIALIISCFLIVFGGWGVVHSIKATIAQKLYFHVRYISKDENEGEREREQERFYTPLTDIIAEVNLATRLYPHNYYMLMYASRCAYIDAKQATTRKDYESNILWAKQFSRRGISINPYQDQLRWLYAETLVEAGKVDEAINYWYNDIVDREYWVSSHHEFLARLYLRSTKSGSLEKAVDELPFVQDSELRDRLNRLKKLLKK